MSAATETTVNATATATTQDEVKQETQDEGFRVYIGNLSYKATEESVREFASSAGGELITVILPQKFKRPSGFAFVHYKTEEQANQAVEKLNDQEVDGRKIRLQVARSREEQAARREDIIAKRDASRAERAAKEEKKGGENETEQETSPKPKKKRAPKAGRRRVPGNESEEAEGEAEATNDNAEAKASKPKKKNNKTRKAAAEARIDGDATEDAATETKEKKTKPKAPQRKLELSNDVSPNTIFVANLPFSATDDDLAAVFTNLSIAVKSAKVVVGLRRPRGGKPFRASRGFGFVEIENASQQQEAVEKVEGTLIGDRKITAKIANEMKPIEEAEVKAATEEPETAPAA